MEDRIFKLEKARDKVAKEKVAEIALQNSLIDSLLNSQRNHYK